LALKASYQFGKGRNLRPVVCQKVDYSKLASFTNDQEWGNREYNNSKQETEQTVLTITKAFTKPIDYTCKAKNLNNFLYKTKNVDHNRR